MSRTLLLVLGCLVKLDLLPFHFLQEAKFVPCDCECVNTYTPQEIGRITAHIKLCTNQFNKWRVDCDREAVRMAGSNNVFRILTRK